MALPQIKLDERTFQDLVDEAKLRIPRYCPEWTNHNVSDPGVALIELFAYMVDHLLYQINRVPDKNYRAFLDMIGVKMTPPNPARAEITFRLSGAQPNPLVLTRGIEVATVRTEGNTARIFTTEADLNIVPPELKHVLITPTSQPYSFTDVSPSALDRNNPQAVSVFPAEPQPGNAFYLGFGQNIARNTLVVSLDCERLGVGINPNDPPLVWEYWDELVGDWQALEVARNLTGGLTIPFSEIELYIPVTAGQREIEMPSEALLAWWIRCRYTELANQQPGYNLSPVINRFSAYTIGGTIPATHSQIIRMEEMGRSTGEAGQVFPLKRSPVLSLNAAQNETVLVIPPDGAEEVWTQVPDFSESGQNDKHFVCDYINGEIVFGPIIRDPAGNEEQRGAVPPYSSRIVMAAYRTGGGVEGNVGSNTITVLKSALPYVAKATNLRAASGGTNAESLEHALMRGPRTLRARNRAVTAEDYEVLTREATSGVARVRCLTPGRLDKDEDRPAPGTVVVMVVPEVDENVRELRPEHLAIPAGMRADITEYLDERRLLATQVDLTAPNYQWVTVQARIKTTNQFVNERVKREAERRLYRFIRPVHGGPDPTLRYDKPGEGWPWGRVLYVSEIFPVLQLIDGVEYVEKVEMFPVLDLQRGRPDAAVTMLDPGPRGLICSYRHLIVLV